MKQAVILTGTLVLFLCALASAYYVFIVRKNQQEIAVDYSSVKVDENLSTQKPSDQNDNLNTGLQVQGTSNSTSSNTLPGPDGFEIYEQYSAQEGTSYIDTKVGQGDGAEVGDKLAMVYKGWLTNGDMFDQSRKNELGQIDPFAFVLGSGQVIQGWDQGIIGMKQGGKRRLIIPASQGYGSGGQGSIPPNSMLIFDVELVQVEKSTNQSMTP